MAWTVDGLAFNTRKELTIDSTLIDADLDNFVVEAMRTDDGDIGADPTANGGDIRFTLVNGTVLTYERELWSLAGGLATFVHHVKVPSVPSAADTVLYCYYNTSTPAPPDGDDGGAGNSWDVNFKGVYHMNQDPSGGAPQILDSTANNNDGTSAGSMTTGDLVDAKVGKGLDFDGINDLLSIPDSISLDLTDNFSISLWFKPTVLTQTNRYVLSKLKTGAAADNTYAVLWEYVNNELEFYSGDFTGTNPRTGSGITISDTNWHNINYTYNGSIWAGYKDGAVVFSVSRVFSINPSNQALFLANLNPADDFFLNASLDEVRISNIARSAPWIKASYHSQNGSLITWGAEEVSAAGWQQQRSWAQESAWARAA